MTKVDEARAAVYLRMMYPGDFTYIDDLIQAVRDEEFLLREKSKGCSWDGSDVPCGECPCDKTRYCP